MTLSRQTIRDACTQLQRLLPPGNPLTAADVVDVSNLITVLREEAASMVQVERGRKIFEWRVRTNVAPTLNQYGFMKHWQRVSIRKALDTDLQKVVDTVAGAVLIGQSKRWLRVTRFTTQPKNIDEFAVDAIGGKMPVDALVRLGVFYDDKPAFMVREAHVLKTTPGNTHLLFEVFETAADAVPCGPPQDFLLPPEEKKLTKAQRAKRQVATLEQWANVGETLAFAATVPTTPRAKRLKKKLPAVPA